MSSAMSCLPLAWRSAARPLLWAAVTLLLAAGPLLAQPGKHKDPLSWDRSVGGLVRRYCYRCHNAEQTRGGVNLAADTNPRLILQHRETWETALLLVEGEEMPPDGPQPTAEERKLIVRFLRETLTDLDCSQATDPGPQPLRRLNRTEYNLVLHDLIGLDLKLADRFAPEPTSFGFDNIGPALSFTPVQVEQYHEAAKKAVAAVVAEKERNPRIYAQTFGETALADEPPTAEQTRAVVERFATRAFRRPVEQRFVDRLMAIYQRSRGLKQDHQTALGHAFTAVLLAPQFLIRVEQNREGAKEPWPVDDYELASRLSFFLWSRGPDEELLAVAADGKLRDAKTLEAQTRRMLRDPRSRALAANFFGQWLGLRDLDAHRPDPKVFPEFDDGLRAAMEGEIEAFLGALVAEDRPITDLIDADYVFVNARLAEHYGLDAVSGEAIRRVAIDDRRRGGVLTSAALLMLQSDPNRTNVPRRGNYIAGRILGAAPPPPPPDVPPLEEAAGEKELPLRALLEKHRSNPTCASCHARIDPLGFSLQNYDALGRWRTVEAGQPIDASGRLPSGDAFDGPVELKDLLLKRKAAFRRNLTKNLLIYALGRGLEPQDDCVLDAAVAAAEQADDRFSALVLSIVQSRPFLYRGHAND